MQEPRERGRSHRNRAEDASILSLSPRPIPKHRAHNAARERAQQVRRHVMKIRLFLERIVLDCDTKVNRQEANKELISDKTREQSEEQAGYQQQWLKGAPQNRLARVRQVRHQITSNRTATCQRGRQQGCLRRRWVWDTMPTIRGRTRMRAAPRRRRVYVPRARTAVRLPRPIGRSPGCARSWIALMSRFTSL